MAPFRLRYKDFEVYFREQISEIVEVAQPELPQTTDNSLPPGGESERVVEAGSSYGADISSRIQEVARATPIGAVTLAWDAVEEAIRGAATRINLPSADLPNPSSIQILNEMRDRNVLSDKDYIVLERMRNLRNRVYHSLLPDYAIAESDALDYGRLAKHRIEELNQIGVQD